MERHIVEIRVEGKYVAVEFDYNMPCLLADEIRKVVKEFYEEDEK